MTTAIEHTEECKTDGGTCIACDEHNCVLSRSDWQYANLIEGWLCYPCYESDTEHGSVITTIEQDGTEYRTLVGDYIAMDAEFGDFVSADNIERTYHRTDGWRGHYCTTLKGWYEVSDGVALWGMPTDATRLSERIKDAQESGTLPCKVAIVSDPTSNVFSVGVSFFVEEENKDAFILWMKGDDEEVA